MTGNNNSDGIALAGEFNIFTAAPTKERLIDAIHRAQGTEIEIDLSEVSEIDTAGLQLMVMAKRLAAEHGKAVLFAGHSSAVLQLLDLCGMSGFFGDPILIRSNS